MCAVDVCRCTLYFCSFVEIEDLIFFLRDGSGRGGEGGGYVMLFVLYFLAAIEGYFLDWGWKLCCTSVILTGIGVYGRFGSFFSSHTHMLSTSRALEHLVYIQ
ncbi:hypothetical protein BDQ17DRAFT_1374438 [Cyathus striatus]|nr:hypothetical protein BDQ17DRAFT_1374438 [Cyathus striatus]